MYTFTVDKYKEFFVPRLWAMLNFKLIKVHYITMVKDLDINYQYPFETFGKYKPKFLSNSCVEINLRWMNNLKVIISEL